VSTNTFATISFASDPERADAKLETLNRLSSCRLRTIALKDKAITVFGKLPETAHNVTLKQFYKMLHIEFSTVNGIEEFVVA
jgi:hypothetical protein